MRIRHCVLYQIVAAAGMLQVLLSIYGWLRKKRELLQMAMHSWPVMPFKNALDLQKQGVMHMNAAYHYLFFIGSFEQGTCRSPNMH